MKLGVAAILLAVVFMVSGCAAATNPASHVMTPKQAAADYLRIVRPLNKAVDNEDAAGDDSWAEFQYYATGTRGAFLIADTSLGSPKSWPARIRGDVSAIKTELNDWAGALQKVANAPASINPETFSFQPSRVEQARGAKAVADLRMWLGLGPDGGGY